MSNRSLFAAFVFALSLLSAAAISRAGGYAGEPAAMQGCGWDYPCAPQPGYARQFDHSGEPRNDAGANGEENAKGGKRGRKDKAGDSAYADCGGGPCDGATDCGGHPCGQKCDAICWIKRLRKGYCGHGCWTYREQAQIVEEEKRDRANWREREREFKRDEFLERDELRAERRMERMEERAERFGCVPGYCRGAYAPPPAPYYQRAVREETPPPRYKRSAREQAPPPRYERRREERPREERPRADDRTPLGRFDGPPYGAN